MNLNQDNLKEELEDLAAQVLHKKNKLDKMFLNIAKEVAKMSYCNRSKVGAVIERYGNIISFGYNGAPKGVDNCCEDSNNVTFPHIIHAESNAILKAAKSGLSTTNATLYLTLSPCLDCSKLILQSEIRRVVYLEEYRDRSGIDFLKQFIIVEKYG